MTTPTYDVDCVHMTIDGKQLMFRFGWIKTGSWNSPWGIPTWPLPDWLLDQMTSPEREALDTWAETNADWITEHHARERPG